MQEQDTTIATIEYRPIAGFPLYRVGSDGSVWSRHSGGWVKLRQSEIGGGYKAVTLCCDGSQFSKRVHRLVCEAFHGPCPEGMEVRHFPENNPSNNAASNLRWGTRKENHADKKIHGTHLEGEKHGMAIISQSDVVLMRSEYEKGLSTIAEIATRFGVSESQCARVVHGESWSHVPGASQKTGAKKGELNGQAKLTANQVGSIIADWQSGRFLQREIAAKYGVGQPVISRIVRGKRWGATINPHPRQEAGQENICNLAE